MPSDTGRLAAIQIIVAVGLPLAWSGAGLAVRYAEVPPTETHRQLYVDHHVQPLHRAPTDPAAHRLGNGGRVATGLGGP